MNKTITYMLFVFSFFTFPSLKAQSNNEIEIWIENHPNIVLIEKSNLESFTSSQIEKLNGNFIVFDSDIKSDDIKNFEARTEFQVNNSHLENSKINEAQEIKNFLAKYPYIKIVKQSEYLSEPSDIQREYVANACLILIGEEISIHDVKNYKF